MIYPSCFLHYILSKNYANFYENVRDNAATVTGDRLHNMSQNFLLPEFDRLGLQHIIRFQQDGATSDTSNAMMNILRDKSPGYLMLKSSIPQNTLLTVPDFFLQGYLMKRVYTNKSTSIFLVKENIILAIATVRTKMYINVMKNMVH